MCPGGDKVLLQRVLFELLKAASRSHTKVSCKMWGKGKLVMEQSMVSKWPWKKDLKGLISSFSVYRFYWATWFNSTLPLFLYHLSAAQWCGAYLESSPMAVLHQERRAPGLSLRNTDLHLRQKWLFDDQQRWRAVGVQRRVWIHDPGPLGRGVHQQPKDNLHSLLRPLQEVGIVLRVGHQSPLQEDQSGQKLSQRPTVCRQ